MHLLKTLLGFRIHYLNIGNDIYDVLYANLPEFTDEYPTRILRPEELLPYLESVPELNSEALQRAIVNKDDCTANFFNGALVGFSFESRARTIVTEQIDLLVPDGYRYGYKGWTHPDHRRANLEKFRSRATIEQRDYPHHERPIWYIETHNYASLLHGYKPPRERDLRVGIIGWYSFFGKQIPFNSRNAKRYGIEMVRREDSKKRQYV